MNWTFKHKTVSILFCVLAVPLCIFMFFYIDKSRMPQIEEHELMSRIEWNENIHLAENRRRIFDLFRQVEGIAVEHSAFIGQQDFLLNRDMELSSSEAELYFRATKPEDVAVVQREIYNKLKQEYPLAVVSFSPPETLFEKLFVTGEPDIVVELHSRNKEYTPGSKELHEMEQQFAQYTGITPDGIAFENQLNISILQDKLLLYNVPYNDVYRILKTAFKENNVTMLHSYQHYLPVAIAGDEKTVHSILNATLVQTQPDAKGQSAYIPLRELITIYPSEDLKSIIAGRSGEYIPFNFYHVQKPEQLMADARKVVEQKSQWDLSFSGSFFSNKKMLNELIIVLFVSILLMYFILAAQFESFLQPLIVLLEIPVDIAFALVLLMLCGHTLNLMSAIGLIVTCGIIINDSILKLDAINELRKKGTPLVEAIHEAGRKRFRPIVMTSLTTILAMVPFLFSNDMGSALQKPLSIAMIGTMVIGTLVSLFTIPLIYWFIYRRQENKKQTKTMEL